MTKNLVKRLLKSQVAHDRAAARKPGSKRPRGHLSPKEFVLKYGREFRAAPLPKGMRRRRAGRCFANALLLAMDQELIYVEGFACDSEADSFLVQHAWCVSDEGEVIDPTWKKPEECAYFGVPFRPEFIREQVRQARMLESVITPGEGGREFGVMNPRLLDPKADFKHPFTSAPTRPVEPGPAKRER